MRKIVEFSNNAIICLSLRLSRHFNSLSLSTKK